MSNPVLRGKFQRADLQTLRGIGCNSIVHVKGKIEMPIFISSLKSTAIEFLVVGDNVMHCNILLGFKFLEDHYMIIDTTDRTLKYKLPGGQPVSITLRNLEGMNISGIVKTMQSVTCPPHSRVRFLAKVLNGDILNGREGYFELSYDWIPEEDSVILACSINKIASAAIVVEAINVLDFEISLGKNIRIGDFFLTLT